MLKKTSDGATQLDPLLLPLLQTSDAAASQQVLERLVFEHATPIIKDAVRHKLHVSLNSTSASCQSQDAHDVYGEVLLHILKRLSALKMNPTHSPIANFRRYVAAVTYSACSEYLRQKYPQRWRLKNRLRYVLTHRHHFALWELDNSTWLCGFTAWREREETVTSGATSRCMLESRQGFRRAALESRDLGRMGLDDLLVAIFTWINGPIGLDRLTTIIAEWYGIHDHTVDTATDGRNGTNLLERVADLHADVTTLVEQRESLQRLWREICELPPRQRTALLLNLRDAQGQDVVGVFPLTGVATIYRIAEVLEIPAKEFAALWRELPLDDMTIAMRLGIKRQQVINLRKAARARLARRTKALMTNEPVRP